MERFSYIAPIGHLSQFSIGTADRLALAQLDDLTPLPDGKHSASSSLSTLHRHGDKAGWAQESEETGRATADFQPGTRFYLAFSALASLSLVTALDGTSISVALPVIAKALNGSATAAFWAGTSFLLASTIFQLIYAAFSQLFGRKTLTLIAVVFFLVGTVIAGAADSMTMLLAGRTIQGIGGGGIMTLTNILVTDLVPLRQRGQWIGVLGAMWAIGSVSGPVVGGGLSSPDLWQWIFWLNLPFITASFVLVTLFIHLQAVPISFLTKLKQADWIGSGVFIGTMTSLLLPMTWGGIMYDWSSWRVLAPFGFGILGLVTLGYHERFAAAQPIIRASVFANRTCNIAYITTAIHGMILWSLLYYQPLYFEGVLGYKPVIAGVALFPATFTVAPMAIIAGLSITRSGFWRWAVWGGWGLTLLGVGFLCAVDVKSQMVQLVITDFAIGIGLGGQFQLQSASDPKHLGTSVAMFTFSRGLGQTLGVAIGGNIFQNTLYSHLKTQSLFAARAHQLSKDATAIVDWLQSAPVGDEKTAMQVAFVDSLRMVYIFAAAAAFLATIASLFIKHYSLNRPLESDQVLAEVEQKKKRVVNGKVVDA